MTGSQDTEPSWGVETLWSLLSWACLTDKMALRPPEDGERIKSVSHMLLLMVRREARL